MLKHICSFQAFSELGDACTIHVHQNFIEMRNALGSGLAPGAFEYTTDAPNALYVNRLEKGVYEIGQGVFGTVRVTSTDPSAP